MRNDKILYSGQTSVSKRLDKLEERAREKVSKQKKLSPAAEVVFDYIEKEKKSIQTQVLNYVQTDTKEENLKSTLLALKFYDTYLITLQNNLKNLLGRSDER
jgi:hypothetical protein